MNEISRRELSFFTSITERRGLSLDDLLVGLPLTARQLRAAPRFDWDVFAHMCDRFEALTSPAECERAGREVFDGPFIKPLVSSAALFFGPQRFWGLNFKWLAPQFYRNVHFSCTKTGPEQLTVVITIPPSHRGSLGWFRIVSGTCAVGSTLFGMPPSKVDAQLSERRGRFVITFPKTTLRDSLRIFRRLNPAEIVGKLFEQEDQLFRLEQERIQAMEAAQAAAHLFRTVFNSVSEAIILVEPDGRFRMVNDTLERLLGWQNSELEGKSGEVVVHPEDVAAMLSAYRRLVAQPGHTATAAVRAKTKSGAYRYFDVTGQNLLADPALRGILLVARDVTERRQAEAALNLKERAYTALLSNLSGMAYRCHDDPAWTMELITEGCVGLTGYRAEELLRGEVTFHELIAPEDAGPLWDKRQANLLARQPCLHEYRIRAKSGELRWVSDLAHGVYGEQGELLAIEGFISDITSRRKLEEQLAHSQRINSIGRLAGGIAHDFNNLLGAMMGYASLAKDGLAEDDPRYSDLEEIESAIKRATDLTSQLLTFARRQVIQPSVIDLNLLILRVDKLLRRILGEDIALITIPGPGLWLLDADPGQLEQVVLNLAINARDAMPGGGHLTIETANILLEADGVGLRGLAAGEYVMLAISDTGEGIAREALPHIFEPFFTTKAQGKGTGLGLATVYGIISQAGGDVLVYSELGKGATFKVYLPKSNKVCVNVAQERPVLAAGKGEVVLVVEDHPMMLNVMVRVLRDAGYQVLVATNGAEALALAASHPAEIDLLVTDLVMPEMNGKVLSDRLREVRPALKILYVSGYTENIIEHHGLSDPSLNFLSKPFAASAFAAKVRAVLEATS